MEQFIVQRGERVVSRVEPPTSDQVMMAIRAAAAAEPAGDHWPDAWLALCDLHESVPDTLIESMSPIQRAALLESERALQPTPRCAPVTDVERAARLKHAAVLVRDGR